MSAPLVQFGSTMMCPHGATVLQIPSQSLVLAGNQPVLLPQDAMTIVGCPFVIGIVPHPCVTVQWTGLATQSTVQHQAPILATSIGLCLGPDSAPQGTVIMSGVQAKALGQ
ncbi:MAG TPA: hypothetical protein VHV78_17050 [Gemmatimonadaceae bacterium]|jgi:hypothetical protein|nr:hypothetical protein [Gemmatimonadaceae bacterium]